MASVMRLRKRKRRLTGNEAKSAVDRPWDRTVLGCTFTTRHYKRRKVSAKALKASQAKVRAITGRTRGRTLRQLMLGGRAFFGVAEVRSPRRDLDNWLRRRRSYHGKPGGRQLAWHTVKAAHGPWRLRQSPALGLPSRTEV